MIQRGTSNDRAGHGAGSCAGSEGAFGRHIGDAAAVFAGAGSAVAVAEVFAVGSADEGGDQMIATEVVLMVLGGD